MTGVVTVKDNRRAIKIYLKNGHVVYADGIDKDSQLIKEIATKRKLGQDQINELKNIKEKDPHSFGKALIDRKFISQAIWVKFLEIKVKQVLAIAFQMDDADLGFSESELDIPPINFLDYNIFQLLLDTIRGMKNLEHFKKHLSGDNAVYIVSADAEELKANIPLSPSEQDIFSKINGKQTVGEIVTATGPDQGSVYKIMYLLLCFGLIDRMSEQGGEAGSGIDYIEIFHLYFDLLKIIEANFQREIGKQFETVFNECKDELTGQSKELFGELSLSKDDQEGFIEEISGRLSGQSTTTESKLSLQSSFNKLAFLLIMRMKKVLGVGLTEKTLKEMMEILEYVEKYREDTEMMSYVRENLQDFLRQIKS